MSRMRILSAVVLSFICGILQAQIILVEDDFEGNGTIDSWFGDQASIDTNHKNPFQTDFNPSATCLEYRDLGGQFANVRFDVIANFDLSNESTFTFKIYVPSTSVTGFQNNQVSLKLQDGSISEPWSTQTEIIKDIELDVWQELSFDFANDDYINASQNGGAPTERTDFNRVLIQVNGEDNNDLVRAYIDDFAYSGVIDPDFNPGEIVYDDLVWSDEFDIDGPVNPLNWHHQTQLPTPNGWYNNEIQHYTDRIDNSYVEDGFLHIKAKEENYTDQGLTLNHTSARLNSKFAFTYGKIEVRAKLPTELGTWPAIWTLGTNIIEQGGYWSDELGTVFWPACGEIDIMEHWGFNPNYIQAALHTPSSFGATENHGGILMEDVANNFHVYSAEWYPDSIVFRVDGFNYYTYAPEELNLDTWPFFADQYILLNVAMINPVVIDFTESEMVIDYVRVYQESVLSTNEKLDDDDLTVFPNPSNGEVFIRAKSALLGSQLTVYTAQGQLVEQSQIRGSMNQIDLSNYPSGLYLISIQQGDQRMLKKLIKQ